MKRKILFLLFISLFLKSNLHSEIKTNLNQLKESLINLRLVLEGKSPVKEPSSKEKELLEKAKKLKEQEQRLKKEREELEKKAEEVKVKEEKFKKLQEKEKELKEKEEELEKEFEKLKKEQEKKEETEKEKPSVKKPPKKPEEPAEVSNGAPPPPPPPPAPKVSTTPKQPKKKVKVPLSPPTLKLSIEEREKSDSVFWNALANLAEPQQLTLENFKQAILNELAGKDAKEKGFIKKKAIDQLVNLYINKLQEKPEKLFENLQKIAQEVFKEIKAWLWLEEKKIDEKKNQYMEIIENILINLEALQRKEKKSLSRNEKRDSDVAFIQAIIKENRKNALRALNRLRINPKYQKYKQLQEDLKKIAVAEEIEEDEPSEEVHRKELQKAVEARGKKKAKAEPSEFADLTIYTVIREKNPSLIDSLREVGYFNKYMFVPSRLFGLKSNMEKFISLLSTQPIKTKKEKKQKSREKAKAKLKFFVDYLGQIIEQAETFDDIYRFIWSIKEPLQLETSKPLSISYKPFEKPTITLDLIVKEPNKEKSIKLVTQIQQAAQSKESLKLLAAPKTKTRKISEILLNFVKELLPNKVEKVKEIQNNMKEGFRLDEQIIQTIADADSTLDLVEKLKNLEKKNQFDEKRVKEIIKTLTSYERDLNKIEKSLEENLFNQTLITTKVKFKLKKITKPYYLLLELLSFFGNIQEKYSANSKQLKKVFPSIIQALQNMNRGGALGRHVEIAPPKDLSDLREDYKGKLDSIIISFKNEEIDKALNEVEKFVPIFHKEKYKKIQSRLQQQFGRLLLIDLRNNISKTLKEEAVPNLKLEGTEEIIERNNVIYEIIQVYFNQINEKLLSLAEQAKKRELTNTEIKEFIEEMISGIEKEIDQQIQTSEEIPWIKNTPEEKKEVVEVILNYIKNIKDTVLNIVR